MDDSPFDEPFDVHPEEMDRRNAEAQRLDNLRLTCLRANGYQDLTREEYQDVLWVEALVKKYADDDGGRRRLLTILEIALVSGGINVSLEESW